MLGVLLAVGWSQPDADRIPLVPGYDAAYSPRTFGGYLATNDSNKELYYLFTESESNSSSDPVTLWLNGGPGCSSLLGYIQEVGPYFLEDGVDYKQGDKLTRNPYSWAKASNLLFIESPAGVGFSVNPNRAKGTNDSVTADDMLQALLDWRVKFPLYQDRKFWIAGQSYAGKYIPDLAVAIDFYNQKANSKIPLQGVLIGNGVMTFENRSLQLSTIQYVKEKEFLPSDLDTSFENSCMKNPKGAACDIVIAKFSELTRDINPYNVFGYCFYRNATVSQAGLLQTSLKFTSSCSYDLGMTHYFSLNAKSFKAKVAKWDGPCANIPYTRTEEGSIDQLRYLIFRNKYKIVLYNGDWDAVVPYVDTLKNIPKLLQNPVGEYRPWFAGGQHAGFYQNYSGLRFVTVKGASHQVPQSQRQSSFQLFRATLAQ